MSVADQFDAWVRADPVGRTRLVIVGLILLTTVPLLGLTGYLWQYGRRTGGGRGQVLKVLAVLLGLAAVSLGLSLWALLAQFTTHG